MQCSMQNNVETQQARVYAGADPGFGVRGDEIRQGDPRVHCLRCLWNV